MRRGFVFTLDALLAFVLMTLFIASILTVTENASAPYTVQLQVQNEMVAQNLLDTLRTVPLNQLVSPSKINSWIEDGVLNLTYVTPQMSPLQIAATYWALSEKDPSFRQKAEVILGYVLRGIAGGYSYQLIINNYTSPYLTFNGSYSNSSNVGSATLVVSGYVRNTYPRGYVAKAYVIRLVVRQHKLLSLPEILGGRVYCRNYWRCRYNSMRMSTQVTLPQNSTNITGEWLMVRWTSGESPRVYINGYELDSWEHEYLGSPPLQGGNNSIEVTYRTTSSRYYKDQLGIGYGFLLINYTTNTPLTENPGLVKLWRVSSRGTGIVYLQPLMAPGHLSSVSLHLTVNGVHEVRVYFHLTGNEFHLVYENTSLNGGYTVLDVRNLLPNITQFANSTVLDSRSWSLVIALDSYYSASAGRFYYEGQDYGYGVTNRRILYGYPRSYILLNYTENLTRTPFMIPMEHITRLYPDGTNYNTFSGYPPYMYFTYYLPSKAIPWYVYVTTDEYILGYPTGELTVKEGPNARYDVIPPFPLDYYMIVFAYHRVSPDIMVPGENNTFLMSSNSWDYTFRPWNSRAIVHYFLNGYAPYGEVFPKYAQSNACGYNLTYWYRLAENVAQGSVVVGNCPPDESPMPLSASQLKPEEYALDDAIVRLFLQLGASESLYERGSLPGSATNPILIKLEGLRIDAVGLRNVPATVQPVEVTLRVWREKG